MVGEGEKFSTILPEWLPRSVAATAQRIKNEAKPDQLAILDRLLSDQRMQDVWNELLRRNRQTGEFFHPAKLRGDIDELATQDKIQAESLGYLLYFVFCATRDKISVSKHRDSKPLRDALEERARILREIADDLEPLRSDAIVADAVDVLRMVAGWQEDGIDLVRPPDDPLTIQNDRGDRAVRGVQIVIAAQLQELFGKRLDGTAATLASVALGQPTSERVTRSAFSDPK